MLKRCGSLFQRKWVNPKEKNHELNSDGNDNDNIKVIVRISPCSKQDQMKINKLKQKQIPAIIYQGLDNMKKKAIIIDAKIQIATNYNLDNVFTEKDNTLTVYKKAVSPILDNFINGYNATVFAYGMTGAGKTHTMFGSMNTQGEVENSPGLVIYIARDLFKAIGKLQGDTSFKLRCSYLEIYNEQVKDLLNEKTGNLMILQDQNGNTFVNDLSEHIITDPIQLLQLIKQGNAKRTMASTMSNKFSSRSHALIQLKLDRQIRTKDIKQEVLFSKLLLIDLAGSERASVTENRGIRMIEGANINKSLLALANCINILSDKKKKGAFVPYRDSKLTRLLKESLGGNTKSIMIACISSSYLCYEETINTLKYASRARAIKRKVKKNIKEVIPNQLQYKSVINDLKNEISQLKTQLNDQKEQFQKVNNNQTSLYSNTLYSKQHKNIEEIEKKLFTNMEENFNIIQTINELEDLQEYNTTQLQSQLKNSKESETDTNSYEIIALRKNMKNNKAYLNKMQEELKRNKKEKASFSKQLSQYMAKCLNVQDLQSICQTLTQDKLKLYTQNLEMKQKQKIIQKQKSSEKQKLLNIEMKLQKMKKQLKQKVIFYGLLIFIQDEIIKNNNKLIDNLKKNQPNTPSNHQFASLENEENSENPVARNQQPQLQKIKNKIKFNLNTLKKRRAKNKVKQEKQKQINEQLKKSEKQKGQSKKQKPKKLQQNYLNDDTSTVKKNNQKLQKNNEVKQINFGEVSSIMHESAHLCDDTQEFQDMTELFNPFDVEGRQQGKVKNQKKITGIKIRFPNRNNNLMNDIMNMEMEIQNLQNGFKKRRQSTHSNNNQLPLTPNTKKKQYKFNSLQNSDIKQAQKIFYSNQERQQSSPQEIKCKSDLQSQKGFNFKKKKEIKQRNTANDHLRLQRQQYESEKEGSFKVNLKKLTRVIKQTPIKNITKELSQQINNFLDEYKTNSFTISKEDFKILSRLQQINELIQKKMKKKYKMKRSQSASNQVSRTIKKSKQDKKQQREKEQIFKKKLKPKRISKGVFSHINHKYAEILQKVYDKQLNGSKSQKNYKKHIKSMCNGYVNSHVDNKENSFIKSTFKYNKIIDNQQIRKQQHKHQKQFKKKFYFSLRSQSQKQEKTKRKLTQFKSSDYKPLSKNQNDKKLKKCNDNEEQVLKTINDLNKTLKSKNQKYLRKILIGSKIRKISNMRKKQKTIKTMKQNKKLLLQNTLDYTGLFKT